MTNDIKRAWPGAALLLMLMCAAPSAQAQYQLKADTRETGSQIVPIIAESNIPFAKSYKQLTAEQRAKFRASYTGLTDKDEPPFPESGSESFMREISKAAQLSHEERPIHAVALVDSSGDVQKVTFFETTSEQMSRIVTSLLLDEKFKPGLCNGAPCDMEFPFIFTPVPRSGSAAISRSPRHCSASVFNCPPG